MQPITYYKNTRMYIINQINNIMRKLMLFVLAVILGIAGANAQGTGTIVVADGTTTNQYVPIYGLYTDSYLRCQTIYPETMLTEIAGKDIQGITYYLSSSADAAYTGTFQVKIGTCTASTFETEEFDGTSTLTTVYTGTLDCTGSTVTIDFDAPFAYTGGNILIEVNCITPGNYKSASYYGVASTNSSVQGYKSSSSSWDAITATYRNFIPKTGFIVPVSCGTPSFGTIVPSETSAVIPINEPNSATSWSFKYNDGAWTTITENPYTLTGLTANTDYTVYVRSICRDGDTSMVATASFHTTCAAESFPYSEDFEGFTASEVPDCWTNISGNNYVEANSSWSTYASQGTKALHMQGPGTIATPIINIAGNDVFVSFDMKCENVSNSGDMAIGVALSPSMIESAVWIDTIDAATSYNRYEYTFHNTLHLTSGCIIFKQVNTTATNYYYWIDSLTVSEPPACAKPINLTLDNATENSLTLSWTENGSATKWVVKVGDEEWTQTTENPYTISGLTANTEYAISVRSFCDPDTSDAVSGTFRTTCAAESFPYSEGFEGFEASAVPDCWTSVAGTTTVYGSSAYEGTKALRINSNGTIVSPVINVAGNDVYIHFYAQRSSTYAGKLAIGLATSPATVAAAIYIDTIEPATLNTYDEYEFTFSNTLNIQSGCIVFKQIDGNYSYYYYYLDNLSVSEPPACPKPSDLTLDEATENSLTISWTENGSASKWVVKVNDGEWAPTTENPYTITGLDAGTNYTVTVRAFCDPDTSDAISETYSTLCAVEAIPYSEDFEGISSGLPNCWEQEASNAGRSKWDFSNAGNTGNCVFFEDYWAENSRLILPVVDCSSLATGAQMSFYFKNPLNSYSLNITYDVYYRTSSTGEWTIISDASVTDANADWTIAEFVLPNSANAAYYQVSILATGADTYNKPALYIDDIYIGVPASCARPSNLTAEAAETSLTLSWNENGSATKWVVKVDDGAWTETTQNPYTINDLTANTEYAVSVRSFCDPDTSEAVNGTFRTLCSVIAASDLPYFEGFEGDISCWDQENISGNIMWEADGLYSYYGATAYEGAEYYGLNGYDAETRLISPVFNLAGIDNVTLKLAHIQPAYDDYYQDNLTIEYRLSSTGEWQTLATYTEDITEWQSVSFDIANPGATFQFAFRATLDDGYGVGIDSVSLSTESTPQPTCDVPTALAAGNVTASSAVISWTGSAAQYEVEFNGQSSTVTTNSYNATGLTAATDYAVRVRALCDGGLTSEWSAAVSFTTLNGGGEDPTCDVPTAVTTSNITATSVTVSWTGTASQYEVEVTDGTTPVSQTVTANQYTFTGLTASTNYTVRVRAICDGGVTSDWSAAQSFTTPNGGEPQGIDDVNASYSVTIYPNPAKNTVTISVDGLSGKAQVSVIDMSGRTVMTSTMESDATQLNVSKLAQGTYFVRINGESISTVRKLVVK